MLLLVWHFLSRHAVLALRKFAHWGLLLAKALCQAIVRHTQDVILLILSGDTVLYQEYMCIDAKLLRVFWLLSCRLVPLSMLVSWEARAQMPTRQLSLVTLLVTHSRILQAHLSTFSSSSWLLSRWCLRLSSRLTPGRA